MTPDRALVTVVSSGHVRAGDPVGVVAPGPTTGKGGGPTCRCGSRDTEQVGGSALMRQCRNCGETYFWRLVEGRFVPLTLPEAEDLDRRRWEMRH